MYPNNNISELLRAIQNWLKTPTEHQPIVQNNIPNTIFQSFIQNNNITNYDSFSFTTPFPAVSTHVEKLDENEIKEKVKTAQNNINVSKDIKAGNCKMKNHDYKNHPKYQSTLNIVEKEYKSHRAKGAKIDNFQIESITHMILDLSDKYQISDLAPIIAGMLGVESGGYVFNDRVMKNSGRQFKGVMQVDFENCCSIYGESSNAKIPIGKNRYITAKKSDDVYKNWHKKHFMQDDSRIAELKKKYPTPEDLYIAMQNDVTLGIEVGIIAFKAKASECRGNIASAIKKYCGNQYTCDFTDVPTHFNVKDNIA